MAMKFGKVVSKFGVLTVALAFAGAVYAGSEPAPPSLPYKLSQPSIKGTLVFLPAADPLDGCAGEPTGCEIADLIFVGTCQKEPVQVFFPNFPLPSLALGEDITTITEGGLDGRYLEFFYAIVVAPQNGNLQGVCDTDPSMAVTSVNGFVNRSGFVNADVTLKFAPPK